MRAVSRAAPSRLELTSTPCFAGKLLQEIVDMYTAEQRVKEAVLAGFEKVPGQLHGFPWVLVYIRGVWWCQLKRLAVCCGSWVVSASENFV